MAHYIGVFMPLEAGGWRGLVPDVPACEATAPTLDLAVSHAASMLSHRAAEASHDAGEFHAPRDLTEIRNDEAWASDHAIDWTTAVVTMIPMPQ